MTNNTTNYKEVQIPFSGLYETIHSINIDAMQLDEDGNEPNDYSMEEYEVHKRYYLSDYVNKFFALLYRESLVDINYDKDSMELESPQYYNFTTDRIFVKISQDSLVNLFNDTDKDILKETIAEQHTSRDGFASFYSGDIDNEAWSDCTTYDHNQWHTVLLALVKQYDMENNNNDFTI